jgi:response regulator RpfG family c-di-GMP phosphodiesterase
MATAISNINMAIECIKKGADDYIYKPFNLNEVSICVLKTLEKRELQLKIENFHNNMRDKLSEQRKEIRAEFLEAIASLVFALEAKDKYTAGHTRKVTEIAVAIAKDMGLSDDDIDDIRWAGLLHDVGKNSYRPDNSK